MRTSVASVVVAMLASVSGCAHTSGGLLPAPRCSDIVQTTVNASHKTLTVAYTEPSVNEAGHPLKELDKTSVYYDLGGSCACQGSAGYETHRRRSGHGDNQPADFKVSAYAGSYVRDSD